VYNFSEYSGWITPDVKFYTPARRTRRDGVSRLGFRLAAHEPAGSVPVRLPHVVNEAVLRKFALQQAAVWP